MASEQSVQALRRRFCRRTGLCWLLAVLVGPVLLVQLSASAPNELPRDTPQPIYSDEPGDSWNRIFYCLFSGRIEARRSADYPDAAPFTKLGKGPPLQVSTRTFESFEIGDRAIDPRYMGAHVAVTEPKYSELINALKDALDESTARPVLARALMQSDLWSAYDRLNYEYARPQDAELEKHRRLIEDLLGRLIRKIALTPEELRSLPNNYSAAMLRQPLPDLFARKSGWVEVLWFSRREHETSASDRRVARIFLKPARRNANLKEFVDAVRENRDPAAGLDGVALIMQLLLIDSKGTLTPTSLTTDVQVRLFDRATSGVPQKTKAQMTEISRRILLSDPSSGGLAFEAEDSPAYFPAAGNDYNFASRQIMVDGPPIQVHLRTRCAACHEEDLSQVMTFSMVLPPHFSTPTIQQLDPAGYQEAEDVIARKKKRPDFKALSAYFEKSPLWWPLGLFGL